jgi:hypothetical protein
VNDVATVVLVLILPAILVIGLVLSTRSRTWSGDHPIAARRLGMLGGALGVAVAAFWVGRFLRWW